MINICYNATVEEVIKYIKLNTKQLHWINLDNGICAKVKTKKVIIQQKKWYHPFQRRLVCKIYAQGSQTMITGHFLYPLSTTIMMVSFLMIFISKNIEAIQAIPYWVNKITILLFFLFIYLILFLIVYSGKFLYKEQEKNVVIFLYNIAEHFSGK